MGISRHAEGAPVTGAASGGLRLNVGCGPDRREGYVNVDMHAAFSPDVVADVSDMPMFPDGCAVEVLARDVLEHLPRRATLETLVEWNRVLAPGGRLSIRVPSLEAIAGHLGATRSFAEHETWVRNLFGSQAYPGDFHLTTFTRPLLEGYLDAAGFGARDISLAEGWLFDAGATKTRSVANAERDRRRRLLAVEGDEGFVEALFATLLHRAPDPEGRRFLLGALASGMMTREQAYASMSGSPERTDVVARAFVSSLYHRWLRREPDPEGLEHYRAALVSGTMTEEDLENAFRGAAERGMR